MLLGLLLVINLWAFALFGWDKAQAKNLGWRVSERSFLLLAVCGGWPALKLGQRVFRHKTRKQPFRTELTMAIGLNLVAVAVLGYLAGPELRARAFDWPEVPLSVLLSQPTVPQDPTINRGASTPSQGTHRFFQSTRP
ncbi:MAG: DUF1294 domain-containing protein [Antarcticimicrobium sp.]|uniref:DUF1294 domain-containing protein n=1 Tax=Antarcticimicrobium sp. TaxID=2824147 RepID=UPI00260B9781|nr:DUF1294 domain-containing protein [Antarcticimicrobium sp.]MDF1717572.1 DUF1294 domain-containing protein [Antarcticimicrobium sp.]